MAAVQGSSLNPYAPEYIPVSTLPLPPPPSPFVLLPLPPFPPAMLPPHPFPPAMILPHPFPPAMLPPLPPPTTVDLPPQENVRPRRQRRHIPPRLGGLVKHDVIPISLTHEDKTTVMIKNIPYHYNREMVMQFLNEYCFLENQNARNSNGENFHVFADDFLNNSSIGNALVNFTDHRTLWKFFGAFNDKLNVFPGSVKSVEIVTAEIQGKNALVNRFKNTRFMCESERFLPVWFNPSREGYGEWVQMITVGALQSHSK
ncbi:hypothetical protein R3W88_003918 [Solanum pinnatisectum]|uniref:Mei2-like C-terminal RNA recognition motif domain-containing protein n=1 Tax=Solanum pinnatisectum TaxID=50273 RepID=A0AAV9MR30_9SOLN|nr:hypothetical protein R3W88_003918 [Solanum pinnatisectum]